MRSIKFASLVFVMFAVANCSTPQEDAAKAAEGASRAEEEKTERRMELVEKYQVCMKKYKGNKEKQDVCNSFLEASKALK